MFSSVMMGKRRTLGGKILLLRKLIRGRKVVWQDLASSWASQQQGMKRKF